MRWLGPFSVLLLLSACSLGAGGVTPSARPKDLSLEPVPPGPPPNWAEAELFFDPSEATIYAVGRLDLTGKAVEQCPKDKLLLDEAADSAQQRLALLFGGTDPRLSSAKLNRAWFDGTSTLRVVISVEGEPPGDAVVPHLRPADGAVGPAAIEAARGAVRWMVLRAGVCDDPYRRADFPCCGPLTSFCADPSRIDRTLPDGSCRCGEQDPCLFDFQCEERQGSNKCICQGDRCPCTSMIKCRKGQTCSDGRCY